MEADEVGWGQVSHHDRKSMSYSGEKTREVNKCKIVGFLECQVGSLPSLTVLKQKNDMIILVDEKIIFYKMYYLFMTSKNIGGNTRNNIA